MISVYKYWKVYAYQMRIGEVIWRTNQRNQKRYCVIDEIQGANYEGGEMLN
jgi:hypothetical protein